MQPLSYKFRLYPTAEQARILSAWQAACWEVQRLCVIERRQHSAYARRCKVRGITPVIKAPNLATQGRSVTDLRALYPEWAFVPADTMAAIVRRVDAAQQKAFETTKQTGKFARIRWAEKAEQVGLTFRGQPDRGTQMVAQGGRFTHWKLSCGGCVGILKVRQHRPFPDGVDIRQVHITRNTLGWFISFSCLVPDTTPHTPPAKAVNGVDIGCIHEGTTQRIAVVDDGRVFSTTDHLKRNTKRLATLQKLVSNRRVRGAAKHADPNSKRTAKRRARIAKLQATITRQRDEVLHYTARRLVDTAQTVAFEDLNHTAMRSKGKGRRKRGLNRSLSTAAPGRLIALTQEKAARVGGQVVKVNARNTSQLCSACGALPAKKGLHVRVWRCAECGAQHDRDVNAARNIAQRANNTGAFSAGVPGEGASVVDRKRRSVNLEATSVAGGENTAGTSIKSVRNSQAVSDNNRVSRKTRPKVPDLWHQEDMFG